ncbi:MAG: lyase family protein, partial [Bacteroidota bacterium]
MRVEKDFLGKLSIPEHALHGIHSERAKRNFPSSNPFDINWYKSLGTIKKACYLTCLSFVDSIQKYHPGKKFAFHIPTKEKLDLLIVAAEEIESGKWFEHFIVPAIQGGAGTSINMNINEIITNRALILSGIPPGSYEHIDPVEDANIYQSTNDVIPTSLKLTIIQLLNELEEQINATRKKIENLENSYRNTLRIAYTQMQEAVPSTYGRLFSTYNDALSRDWWRVSKCFERVKVVNLGGSAIGTGTSVPRFFMVEVIQQLHKLTGLPLTRGENLQDATCNLDPLVEVHGIMKAHAVNLEKISNDLRLLSSDLLQKREIQIPAKQMGSSIMPGKENPVIPEFVISAAHKVYANDVLVS